VGSPKERAIRRLGDQRPLISSYATAVGALAARLTMRRQTVLHEELRKGRREQCQNERRGEAISNPVPSVPAKVVRHRESPDAGIDCWTSFAAAPTFVIVAILTEINDSGMSSMLCSAAHDASLLTGMVPMYLLMGAFHSAPWLKLIAGWRRGV
jgi:hypothetical protein